MNSVCNSSRKLSTLSTLFNISEGYKEFKSTQTQFQNKTSDTSFHCSQELSCSNLVVSLVNETPRTGSRMYQAYSTEFSRHSFVKWEKSYKMPLSLRVVLGIIDYCFLQ